MLIYHGGKDATVNPVNFDEQVKQWCGIFGYAYENPVMRRDGAPAVGQVMTVWGERLKGVFGREEPHNLKYWPEVDMEWLGFK
jgi:acetylxylan esterase